VNDDEGGGRRESAPLGLPVDVELDDEDEDEDEDFEELDDDELMPNMHFGLASRAALEAEEGGGSTAPNYIFLINAVVEGSAALPPGLPAAPAVGPGVAPVADGEGGVCVVRLTWFSAPSLA